MYQTKFHTADLTKLTILVTGGAGFIGSNIVEYLVKNDIGKVKILDNLSNGYFKNIDSYVTLPNVEFIEGDIRDLETCHQACQGVDYVLHQAALGSVPRSIEDPILTNSANITGFLNMLVAARDAKVKRFTYAASSSTYGDSKELPKVEENIGSPLSPYAITKYVDELYANVFIRTYGMECVGLRYFNVFGPRQDPKGAYAAVIPLFIDALDEQRQPKIFGDGEQTRDFTFVANAVQANIKSMFAPQLENHVFNVAYGERISLNYLYNTLKELANSTIEPIYTAERTGDIRDSLADISKARKQLGYDPEFSVAEGLAVTYEWFVAYRDFIERRK